MTDQPGSGWGEQASGGFGSSPGSWGASDPSNSVTIPFALAKDQGFQPTDEDRNNAFFAHLLPAAANLIFLGFAVPVLAPLLVLWIARNKNSFVLFHINQSLVFQGVVFVAYMALIALVTLITFVTCGVGAFLYVLVIPFPLFGFAYPLVVGLAAQKGEWSEYWNVGERVLNARNPLIR